MNKKGSCRLFPKYRITQQLVSLNMLLNESQSEKGLRQRDSLLPKLFLELLKGVCWQSEWKRRGIKVDRAYLSSWRFADYVLFNGGVIRLEKINNW